MSNSYETALFRVERLEAALKPFAAIADEYDDNNLDECRPDWIKRGIKKLNLEEELYSGRGGKTLITLGHVLEARAALRNDPSFEVPELDPFTAKVIAFYNASIPFVLWESLDNKRRNEIIANYKSLIDG